MLTELYIQNFAIIDTLRLPFVDGFNVLTGETGAGKSIILDAVMLVLGGRADRSFVRAGCPAAQVEATYALDVPRQTLINPILEREGLEGEVPDELMIGREVRQNGRTVCRVNGRTVNVGILQQIGEHLIDVHGQGSHLSLLKPKSHLPLLDSYAGLEAERAMLTKDVRQLRQYEQELAMLHQDERTVAQRVDMLRFQVQEISAENLVVGEEDELKAERSRLANAEQLMLSSAEAHAVLDSDSDEEATSAIDRLNQAERALLKLTALDPSREELVKRLQGLLFQINELAGEVSDYQDSLEVNTGRLNEVEQRLEAIAALQRKYGDDVASILAFAAQAESELAKIETSGEQKEKLSADIDKLLRKIGKRGAALSKKRQSAAKKLAQTVENELGDLLMTARFEVRFDTHNDDASGAYVGDTRLAFDATGIDDSEFLISTNPGEPLKPMAKVASGGETARLMLALKTALAQVDATPTLIFDEIDQGIGGRIGETVGRKLWGLTAVGKHQVIVVTHLPQLAVFGDRHYHVSKAVSSGRTRTQVVDLDRETRISELADMIGTDATHARGGAAAILDSAAQTKNRIAKSLTGS